MTRTFVAAALTLALLSRATGQTTTGRAAGQSGAEGEVIAIESRRARALAQNNLAELERLFSDDLSYAHSHGVIDTKSSFLDSLRSGDVRYLVFDEEGVNARRYGDVVLLRGRASVQARVSGEDQSFRLLFTTVYVRESGDWRMVAWHSTRPPTRQQ